ncbi:MAG: HAMP domain-containing sensor histidine kinase [Bacillota bacterium]|nr:HAMP domain-containing sensor histidine kinase [Bacillota bacterium]
MKKETIFKTLYHGFIFAISILIVVCASFLDTEKLTSKEGFINTYYEELHLFLVAQTMELDNKYDCLEFDKEISKEVKQEILDNVKDSLLYYKTRCGNDASFHYQIIDTKNNKTVGNMGKKSPQSMFEGKIIIQNGKVELSQDFTNLTFFTDPYLNIVTTNFESLSEKAQKEIYEAKVKWVYPKDIEIQFQLDKKIAPNSFFYSFYRQELGRGYERYFAVMFFGSITILLLLVLFGKYSIQCEMIPFKEVKRWKFEMSFVIFSVICTMLSLITNALSKEVMIGTLQPYVPETITYLGIVVLWMITLYSISCVYYILKQMFKMGFIKYIKEQTILYSCWKWIKGKILDILHSDLSQPIYKKVIMLGFLNILVFIGLVVLGMFGKFGIVLMVVYAICILSWTIKEVQTVRADYQMLLLRTKQIEQGNYEQDSRDYGLFQEYSNVLNHIQDNFEKVVEEKVKSQNMRNELISNVSHDLKTPLTCIKNYVTLLEDDTLEESIRKEYVENLSIYTNRLQSCIQDLFDISKVNSQTIVLNKEELDIVSLVKQVGFEWKDELEKKNLQIVDNLSGSCMVSLDSEKTVRIFENLFGNISKYALSNSRVYLDLEENEEGISFIFKNISQAPMNFTPEEIVERFVRGDKSRHETGSGLGLAIVKSFTEVQDGSFEIRIEGDLFLTRLTFRKD